MFVKSSKVLITSFLIFCVFTLIGIQSNAAQDLKSDLNQSRTQKLKEWQSDEELFKNAAKIFADKVEAFQKNPSNSELKNDLNESLDQLTSVFVRVDGLKSLQAQRGFHYLKGLATAIIIYGLSTVVLGFSFQQGWLNDLSQIQYETAIELPKTLALSYAIAVLLNSAYETRRIQDSGKTKKELLKNFGSEFLYFSISLNRFFEHFLNEMANRGFSVHSGSFSVRKQTQLMLQSIDKNDATPFCEYWLKVRVK